MKQEIEKSMYRAARNYVNAFDSWQALGGIPRRNRVIKRRWELKHAVAKHFAEGAK